MSERHGEPKIIKKGEEKEKAESNADKWEAVMDNFLSRERIRNLDSSYEIAYLPMAEEDIDKNIKDLEKALTEIEGLQVFEEEKRLTESYECLRMLNRVIIRIAEAIVRFRGAEEAEKFLETHKDASSFEGPDIEHKVGPVELNVYAEGVRQKIENGDFEEAWELVLANNDLDSKRECFLYSLANDEIRSKIDQDEIRRLIRELDIENWVLKDDDNWHEADKIAQLLRMYAELGDVDKAVDLASQMKDNRWSARHLAAAIYDLRFAKKPAPADLIRQLEMIALDLNKTDREYDWEEEQIGQLIEDVASLSKEDFDRLEKDMYSRGGFGGHQVEPNLYKEYIIPEFA